MTDKEQKITLLKKTNFLEIENKIKTARIQNILLTLNP